MGLAVKRPDIGQSQGSVSPSLGADAAGSACDGTVHMGEVGVIGRVVSGTYLGTGRHSRWMCVGVGGLGEGVWRCGYLLATW